MTPKTCLLILLVFSVQGLIRSEQAEIIEPRYPQEVHLAFHETSYDSLTLSVMWTTDESTNGLSENHIVQWGTASGAYTSEMAATEAYNEENPETYTHTALMGSLSWNTPYYYRVGSPLGWSKEFTTTTPHAPKFGTTRVAVYGDMGIYAGAPYVRDLLDEYGKQGNLDAIIHCGDVAYAFENWWKLSTWFNLMQPVMSRTPYHVAPGNRDFNEIQHRFSMPPTGEGNRYYSWTIGSVYFVAIDTQGDLSPTSPQLDWLALTLQKAKEEVTESSSPIAWIVVYGHRPPYTSSDGHDGSNLDVRSAVEPLFTQFGVDIAFWGDDHGYERTTPVSDGQVGSTHDAYFNKDSESTIHMVVGTGGIGLDPFKEEQPAWSVFRESVHGFAYIEASFSELHVKFQRIDDSTADSFVIHSPSAVRVGFNGNYLLWMAILVLGGYAAYRWRTGQLRAARVKGSDDALQLV